MRVDAESLRHPSTLRRFDVATGKLGAVLLTDENYDADSALFYRSPNDGHILGMFLQRKGPETLWLDPVYQGLQDDLNRALPNAVVRIVGSDHAENRFLVYVYSDRMPGRYFYFQRNPAQLTPLVDTRPWIDPERMLPMQLISHQSRDGFHLEGYYRSGGCVAPAIGGFAAWRTKGARRVGLGPRGAVSRQPRLCGVSTQLSLVRPTAAGAFRPPISGPFVKCTRT